MFNYTRRYNEAQTGDPPLYVIYMYICIYVCIYLCLSIYISIYLYLSIYIYIHISIYISISIFIYLSSFLPISIYIYRVIYLCLSISPPPCICIHICTDQGNREGRRRRRGVVSLNHHEAQAGG